MGSGHFNLVGFEDAEDRVVQRRYRARDGDYKLAALGDPGRSCMQISTVQRDLGWSIDRTYARGGISEVRRRIHEVRQPAAWLKGGIGENRVVSTAILFPLSRLPSDDVRQIREPTTESEKEKQPGKA